MARGKGNASASISGSLSEDYETAEADHVETNDSIQMPMGVEELDTVFVDEGEEEILMEATISQPNMTLEELDTVFEDEGEVETLMEGTTSHPNMFVDSRIDKNKTTEENDDENVADTALDENKTTVENNHDNVSKEVINGECVAEIAMGDGEDMGPEHDQNTEKNNEEDAEGSNGETNHEDVSKEEHIAKGENEGDAICMVRTGEVENKKHSNKENDEEEVEKSPAQRHIMSRKRKRGKNRTKNSLKKLASKGKNKEKMPSNGEEDAENEEDALCKDGSTREGIMEQNNGEENNKKKVGESSNQKLIKSKKRKRGKRNRLGKSVLENMASEGRGEMRPKKMTSDGEDKESLKVGSTGEDDQSLKKGGAKGEALLGSKNEAPQRKDVPESSNRKSSLKKVEGMGLIFMCNSETKKDCYHYKVLGLPANKRELVENVYKGMRLFLYDVDLKLLYGIYKAAEPGGYNIEPKAFKSQFPSQVRFMVMKDCKPLAEEKFKKAIKKNYYTRNKFNCQLTSEQVKDLCKLFTADSQSSTAKKLRGRLKKESKRDVERDRTGKHRVDKPVRLKAERKRGVERDRAGKRGVERDRDSKRGVKRDRRRSPVKERRYSDYSHHYENDAMDRIQPLSHAPVAQGPRVIPFQHYLYDRPLETNAYRRGPLLVRDDSYRTDAYKVDVLLPRPYYYRREPQLELHDSYRLRETTNYDRHASYRERPSRDEPVYYSVDRSTEYRSAEVSVPEYHVTSRSLPEHRTGGLRPEYQSSAGLRRYPY